MKTNISALLILISLIFATPALSQKKSSGSSAGGLGIGLRLGDPTGLTGKLYTGKMAIELSIGRSSYWGYGRYGYYHHNKDYWYDKHGYYWSAYDAGTPISTQLHFLWHKPIKQVDGLDWYVGVGPQLRFQTFRYEYWEGGYVRDGRYTNIDFGADGVIGLEYTIPDIPLSVFLDANFFMEFVDQPFAFFGQGGVGVRYNFR